MSGEDERHDEPSERSDPLVSTVARCNEVLDDYKRRRGKRDGLEVLSDFAWALGVRVGIEIVPKDRNSGDE